MGPISGSEKVAMKEIKTGQCHLHKEAMLQHVYIEYCSRNYSRVDHYGCLHFIKAIPYYASGVIDI